MGPDAAVPPALRTWVTDRVLAPVTTALAAVALTCAVLDLTGVAVPMAVQLVPFAVSVLVFGLPHGALDHLVPARLRPGTSTVRSVVVVVVLYLVVGTLTAAPLVGRPPLLGFAVFVGITWFHWGQGDLFVDRLLGDGAPVRSGPSSRWPCAVPCRWWSRSSSSRTRRSVVVDTRRSSAAGAVRRC